MIDKPPSSELGVLNTADESNSVSGHSLVERSAEVIANAHFQIYINDDNTKIVARAFNDSGDYNGVQHIGIKYQKHLFVTVVVKRNTIDLYLDGQLVTAGVFDSENLADFIIKITLSI